jgi:indolepyruvate decarboxylase
MSKQPTVADYIVRRLAHEGITDCFGVPGDFAFKLSDAVARSETIRWIGCSNELDAAYAADGYARVRGCSVLMTTYAVGELSALNGVMGAKAERSCVFHLVGMPTMRHQRVRKIIHHTLGDGEFQNFANISAEAACVSAVITPDNCAHEMERLIATARAESRPAYILVASDYAVIPIAASDPVPYPKPASDPDLAKSVAAIAERIEAARSLAVLPAYTVSRFKFQDSLRVLIESLGCPFAAMAMEKGVLSEAHPQSVGIYSGGRFVPCRSRGGRGCRPGHRRRRRQLQRREHFRVFEPDLVRAARVHRGRSRPHREPNLQPGPDGRCLRDAGQSGPKELRILGAAQGNPRETGRQAE